MDDGDRTVAGWLAPWPSPLFPRPGRAFRARGGPTEIALRGRPAALPRALAGETIPAVRASWPCALVAFVVLALGASPAWAWLDAGELAAAGYDLGVAHPPGAPGLLVLLRLSTLLPLGTLGLRMALVSCALAAAALERRGAPPALAATLGLWVLAGLTFVRQARVVEVYALGAALLVVVLWGLDPAVSEAKRTGRRLVAVAAATWAAWCFGDLRLALGPLVLVLWIRAWRARAPRARWAPVGTAWASLVILALPLASIGAPELDWGDPDTLGAMIDQLAARSIREAYADEILPVSWAAWALHGRGVLERLAEDLGAPGWRFARTRGSPRPGPAPPRSRSRGSWRWSSSTRWASTRWAAPIGRPVCRSRSWPRSRWATSRAAGCGTAGACAGPCCRCSPRCSCSRPR